MIRIQGFHTHRGQGPVARLLSTLVLLAVFAIAVTLGFFILVALLGAVAVLAAVLYARFWWLRHKARKDAPAQRGGVILEGEYTVSEHRKIASGDDQH